MCAAAADRTVVNADHSIAPDIGCRLTCYAYLVRREIGHTPGKPATERAITVCDPRGLAWQLYPNVAAVTASLNAHCDLLPSVTTVRNGSQKVGFPHPFFSKSSARSVIASVAVPITASASGAYNGLYSDSSFDVSPGQIERLDRASE